MAKTPEEIAADIVSEACIVGFNMTGRMAAADPDALRVSIAAAVRNEREAVPEARDETEKLASIVTEAVKKVLLAESHLEDDGAWLWEREGNWGIRKVELHAVIATAIRSRKDT